LGGQLLVGRNSFFTYWQAAVFPFLMPVYACISGYCSAPDLGNVKKVDGVIKVIAMYVLAQVFYLMVVRYVTPLFPHNIWSHALYSVNGRHFTTIDNVDGASWKLNDLLSPFWLLWYLFDLCAWRVMLPFWYRLKYPLLCAVFWGPFVAIWWSGGPLWEPIFGYWPLYILGVQAKQHKWTIAQSELSYRALGAFLFVSASLLSVYVRVFRIDADEGSYNLNGEIWHFGNALKGLCDANSYSCMGQRSLIRFVVQFAEVAAVWGCLQIMPHGKVRIITSFGERSIANYIFHPLTGFIAALMGVYGSDGGMALAKEPMPTDVPWWGPYVLIVLIIVQPLFWMSPWMWRVCLASV
jgi:fucose 4-O-acetylase-like acetyltransferase